MGWRVGGLTGKLLAGRQVGMIRGIEGRVGWVVRRKGRVPVRLLGRVQWLADVIVEDERCNWKRRAERQAALVG